MKRWFHKEENGFDLQCGQYEWSIQNKCLIEGSGVEEEEIGASDSKVWFSLSSRELDREELREGITIPSMVEYTSLKKQKDGWAKELAYRIKEVCKEKLQNRMDSTIKSRRMKMENRPVTNGGPLMVSKWTI